MLAEPILPEAWLLLLERVERDCAPAVQTRPDAAARAGLSLRAVGASEVAGRARRERLGPATSELTPAERDRRLKAAFRAYQEPRRRLSKEIGQAQKLRRVRGGEPQGRTSQWPREIT